MRYSLQNTNSGTSVGRSVALTNKRLWKATVLSFVTTYYVYSRSVSERMLIFSQESLHVFRTQKAFLISNPKMGTDRCMGGERRFICMRLDWPSIIHVVMSVRPRSKSRTIVTIQGLANLITQYFFLQSDFLQDFLVQLF